MSATSPRDVTSGFFRVHLWVLLGINTLAAVATFSETNPMPHTRSLAACAIIGGIVSYIGSVFWLYDASRLGRCALVIVSLVACCGSLLTFDWSIIQGTHAVSFVLLDTVTASCLMGTTLSAMFLGHWYLNTPTMKLGPLRRLVVMIAWSLAGRAVLCAWGVAASWQIQAGPLTGLSTVLLGLRWAAGLLGLMLTLVMTWKTLTIPNTQSATGILYVSVILLFLGELASLLLSMDAPFLV